MYSVFLRWRAVNLHWDVQSYDKAKDLEEAAQSSLAPRTLWLPLVSLGPDGSLQATQLRPRSWSWTRLCLGAFCPRLEPRSSPDQDDQSGEVVIRVTSV